MDIEEGIIDGICVIKGEEISPENKITIRLWELEWTAIKSLMQIAIT